MPNDSASVDIVARLLEVLRICLPIFLMIGLGKVLHLRGLLTGERREFISWLLVYLALPALVFSGIAGQQFQKLLRWDLLIPSFLALALLAVLYIILALVLKLKHGFAAAFVFGAYWANTVYMGFPLTRSAYGEEGFHLIATFAGAAMPVYLLGAIVLVAGFGSTPGAGQTNQTTRQRLRLLYANPVFIAAVAGFAVSGCAELFRTDTGELAMPALLNAGKDIIAEWIKSIAGLGQPLALLMVGAALKWVALRDNFKPILCTVTGKLLLLPLFAWLLQQWLYPEADPHLVGVTVLINSLPTAVTSYVVAKSAGADEDFMAAVLVTSTAFSLITVPVWLYLFL